MVPLVCSSGISLQGGFKQFPCCNGSPEYLKDFLPLVKSTIRKHFIERTGVRGGERRRGAEGTEGPEGGERGYKMVERGVWVERV